MSRDIEEKSQVEMVPETSSKEKETLAPEETTNSKKGRGLLHVPSRSSSHRHQPSPTSTGLSGATASDPRGSMDGQSKESKGSLMGHRRNGSASSKQSGTAPTSTPGNTQPNSPATAAAPARKKKGGLLALLGCCGVPDNANALENGEENVPVKQLDKIPPRPTTASHSHRTITPSDQNAPTKQISEKEAQQPAHAVPESSRMKGAATSIAQDQQATPDQGNGEASSRTVPTGAPVVTVEPPNQGTADVSQGRANHKDDDGDVDMQDEEGTANQKEKQPATSDVLPKVPPPPPSTSSAPIPQPDPMMALAAPDVPEQKALLPPIEPHLKGRKCLVLDLDETLVHSSFKVCMHQVKGP